MLLHWNFRILDISKYGKENNYFDMLCTIGMKVSCNGYTIYMHKNIFRLFKANWPSNSQILHMTNNAQAIFVCKNAFKVMQF